MLGQSSNAFRIFSPHSPVKEEEEEEKIMDLPDPQDVRLLPSRNAEEYVRAKNMFLTNLKTLDPHNFEEFANLHHTEYLICIEYTQLQIKTIHDVADILRRFFKIETILKSYEELNEGQKMICENPKAVKVY